MLHTQQGGDAHASNLTNRLLDVGSSNDLLSQILEGVFGEVLLSAQILDVSFSVDFIGELANLTSEVIHFFLL